MFYEDGSAVVYENGNLTENIEAGNTKYSQNMIIDEIMQDLKNEGIEIDVYRDDVTVQVNRKKITKGTMEVNCKWSNGRANVKNYLRRKVNAKK